MGHPLDVVTGAAPTQVGVDTTSAEAVAENYSRYGIVLTNLSSGTIYLGFGSNAAVVGSGVALLGNGGNWSMDEFNFTKEAVNAIAHSNNALLAVQEFIVRA